MAIGFRSLGAVNASTADPASAPGMPAGFLPGDMFILIVGSKAATPPTLVTPAGWNAPANNTTTGGAGAAGIDTGPNRITLCWRIAQAGDTAPAIDLSAAASPTQAAILCFTKGADESWDEIVCANSSDTTGSTTLYDPAAAAQTLLLRTGDWLGVADNINGDAGTPTLPGTLTATGVTFGTVVGHMNATTGTGNDARLVADSAPFVSGAASAGPDRSITYVGANASMAGCSVFFRLRVNGPGRQSRLSWPGRGPRTKFARFRDAPLSTVLTPCTPTIRSVTATLDDSGSATVAATTPGDTQAGDVLLIFHGNDFYALSNMPTPTCTGSPTVTAVTNGIADGGTNAAHVKAYWAVVNTPGANTVTVTETGTADEEKSMIVYVLSGADTTDPIVDADNATGSSASHVAPALTAGASGDLLIIHDNAGSGDSAASYAFPGSMTERYDATNGANYSHCGGTEAILAAGDTGTRTITPDGSTIFGLVTLLVRCAGEGGAPATNAPAEAATATATAEVAAASVAPNAGEAAATAAALDPTITTGINALAELASATAVAETATTSVAPNAGAVAITATAEVAAASIAVNAECATATATAEQPTVQTGSATNAPAEAATATAVAETAAAAVSPNAAPALAAATAETPTARIAPNAEPATAAAAALDATVTKSKEVFPDPATATATAETAMASIAAMVDAVFITAQAFDAEASGGEFNATSDASVTAGRTSSALATAGRTSTAAVTGQPDAASLTNPRTSAGGVTGGRSSTSSVSDG